MDNIINKVTASGIITINPEDFVPAGERVLFDIKPHLFEELLLKEKDFREFVKNEDWSLYKDKHVAVTCTNDAIIPVWAYMLVTTYLQPVAKEIIVGDEKEMYKTIFLKNISSIHESEFADKRIVLKGCGETPIDDFAYAEATRKLLPVAKSIMYGEPCSTVPVYKKK